MTSYDPSRLLEPSLALSALAALATLARLAALAGLALALHVVVLPAGSLLAALLAALVLFVWHGVSGVPPVMRTPVAPRGRGRSQDADPMPNERVETRVLRCTQSSLWKTRSRPRSRSTRADPRRAGA